jgi:hypothetical protein
MARCLSFILRGSSSKTPAAGAPAEHLPGERLQPPGKPLDLVKQLPSPKELLGKDRQAKRNDEDGRAGENDECHADGQHSAAHHGHRELSRRVRPVGEARARRSGLGASITSLWRSLHHLSLHPLLKERGVRSYRIIRTPHRRKRDPAPAMPAAHPTLDGR